VLDIARKYAWYYLHAKTKHGVHSPFVYDLVTKVLEDKTVYEEYARVEKLRQTLLTNRMVTEVEDFGACGAEGSIYERKISDIAARAAKPARWGKLLYRICRYFEVKDMLEFGSSLGISTAYQAFGASQANADIHFVSMEGSKNLVELAGMNLNDLGLKSKVELVQGNFDITLNSVLQRFDKLDYVFLDGNHRKEPTLRYFEALLPKSHNNTVFIFDDIHWSKDMEDAWEEIKAHPAVTVSMDLFYIGLVFIRQEQVEEHFVIRF